MAKKGLGKGLGALFTDENSISIENGITELSILEIEPNKNQPRKTFDEDKLNALASSIQEHGLIQPIIVTKNTLGTYTIVAGERRWRAAKKAGLTKIPAVIKSYSNQTITEIALIENLQREDLNPIEEALGYKALIDEFDLTQEQISRRIGKSRSAIANSMRLLSLEDDLQKKIISGEISEGHARAALSLETGVLREFLINRIIQEGLNVRQAENLARELQKEPKPKKIVKSNSAYDIELERVQEKLASKFGTKVKIQNQAKRGKIEIEYYGNEDLERILSLFNI